MDYDLFSYWSRGETRSTDIKDVYSHTKYLRTRDSIDAKHDYPRLASQYKFSDMGQFIPSSLLPKGLPLFSFLLQCKFRLVTPYISKDDDPFYIGDNPIRKDKVFKTPMISGTSWKGNLRWTAGKKLEDTDNNDAWLPLRIRLFKLFGQENSGEKKYFDALNPQVKESFENAISLQTSKGGAKRGRLHFHPTFFDRIGLEVINPHNRKTKAGTWPITFETVPAGTTGVFTMLYVPFDLMGCASEISRREVADDLLIIGDSLYDMMCLYGFSAKKGISFGIADEKSDGTFEMAGVKLPRKEVKQMGGIVQKTNNENPFLKLKALKKDDQPVSKDSENFSSFKELRNLMRRIAQDVGGAKHDR